jgi:hypothetical protein
MLPRLVFLRHGLRQLYMSLHADGSRPLIVKPTFVKVLAWVCIVLFLFCAVMSWRAGGVGVPLFFLLFVALGLYLLLFSGSVEMDAQTITYRTPLAQYRIKWDEVSRIEIDSQGGNVVFCGENKRLAAVGPMYWSGKDKMEMLKLVGAQAKQRSIETEQTEKAMFRSSKNTKVHV